MRKRFSGLVALVALITVLHPPTFVGAACSGKANANERAFVRKVNRERAKRGLAKLKLDTQLSKPSKLHTKEMIAEGTIHHTPDDVLAKRVTKWEVLGENVGAGGSVKSLHRAFMRSPSHKANILFRDFRYVGVGAKRTPNGKLWVTFTFEAEVDPGTTVTNC